MSDKGTLLRAICRRFRAWRCDHDWQYDHEESQGPWTGYIESCTKCGAITQVPM